MIHTIGLVGACDHRTCSGACPRNIRTRVHGELARQGWSGTSLDDAVLVASELAANAQDHAHGPYKAQLRIGENWCEISITDHGAHGRVPDGWLSRGRGMSIIEAVSSKHGSRHGGGIAVHWARIERGH